MNSQIIQQNIQQNIQQIEAALKRIGGDSTALRVVDTASCRELVPLLLGFAEAELAELLLHWARTYENGTWLLLRAVAEQDAAAAYVAKAIVFHLSSWDSRNPCESAADEVLIRAFATLSGPARDWVAERPAVHRALGLVEGRDYQALGKPSPADQWPRDRPWPELGTPAGVQARLLRKGYNAGPVTGEWNPQTRRALVRFQSDFGLDPSGELDDETKEELQMADENSAAPVATTPAGPLSPTPAPPAPERPVLLYQSGNEHSPTDPFGENTLSVYEDGSVQLVNQHRGRQRTWRGKIEPGLLDVVHKALAAAGFPSVPEHPVPAGSALRKLTVRDATAWVAWHAADALVGYRDAFRVLDSLVRQTSLDAVKASPDYVPGLVRDAAPAD